MGFIQSTDVCQTKDLDLDDVNNMMKVLEKLRVMEAEIHMKIAPIQDTYHMLAKYNVHVKSEELENVEQLQTKWDRLKEQSAKSMGMNAAWLQGCC